MRMADNKWPFFWGGGGDFRGTHRLQAVGLPNDVTNGPAMVMHVPHSSMIWLPFVYANSYSVSVFLLVEPYSLN